MLKIKILSIILLLAAMNVAAQTWQIGSPNAADVIAMLDNDTLTISGTGDMQDYSNNVPWLSATTAVIKDGVTNIGERAFSACNGLTSITIPNSVTNIGSYAFSYCFGLASVTIPNSVVNIGEGVFFGCKSLTSIEVGSANLSYISENEVLFSKDNKTLVCFPAGKSGAYAIPNSVTSIGSYAFSYCSGLTSITIPNSVTSIESTTFYGCRGLTSITIPNSVTSIGSNAFSYCSGLASFTIPNSVTSIGGSAFEYCTGLTDVTVSWTSPISIDNSAFAYLTLSKINLHVPAGTKSIYAAMLVWKDFNIIDDVSICTINAMADANPDFEDWTTNDSGLPIPTNWVYANGANDGSYGTVAQETGAANVIHGSSSMAITILQSVTSFGSSWHLQLVSPPFFTVAGHSYLVTFDAKASTSGCKWQFEWDQSGNPLYTLSDIATPLGSTIPYGDLTTNWMSYTMTFNGKLPVGTGNPTTIAFDMAFSPVGAVIYLDNINIVDETSFTITASSDSNGSISPSGAVSVTTGCDQTYTITPNTGYDIDQVLIDGTNNTTAVSAGSYTFTNVTANHTISVSFKQKPVPTYTITASASSGGLISPSGAVSVNQGDSKPFTFTPNTNYSIADVLIDGVSNASAIASGSYTFTNVTSNHTISVSFVPECLSNIIVQVWDDVLSVINNPANNGGYTFTGYQWLKNGVEIAGETSGNLYLTNDADKTMSDYTCRVTTSNGLTLQSCPLQVSAKSSISAYPNPTDGTIIVESSALKEGDKINVYGSAGTLVKQYLATPNQTKIDLGNQPKGVYIIKVNGKQVKIILL